jgi:hypothetical protein
MLQLLPIVVKSKIDVDEPNLHCPKTDREDPNLAALLNDIDDAPWTNSTADIAEPQRAKLLIESELEV